MKVIVIPNQRYTYRDHKRLGVDYFLNRNINVKVYDISPILYKGKNIDISRMKQYIFDDYQEFSNERDFIEACKELSSDDFIFSYALIPESIKLFQEIKSISNVKFITYFGGAAPETHFKCNHFFTSIKAVCRKLILRFYHPYRFPMDYLFLGSKMDHESCLQFINKNTKIINVHSRDYNLCLETEYNNSHEKDYCVFIDTDVINSLDYQVLKNMNYKISDEQINGYYEKLDIFFQWIENTYNVSVIIAPHPKSLKYVSGNKFNNFSVVHDKTAELVKASKFVISEGSTAISFPVFFEKPLVLFSMCEISFFKYGCTFAKSLKKDIVNIDQINTKTKMIFDQELENFKGYNQYKNNYITFNDNKLHSYDLIAAFLKNK